MPTEKTPRLLVLSITTPYSSHGDGDGDGSGGGNGDGNGGECHEEDFSRESSIESAVSAEETQIPAKLDDQEKQENRESKKTGGSMSTDSKDEEAVGDDSKESNLTLKMRKVMEMISPKKLMVPATCPASNGSGVPAQNLWCLRVMVLLSKK
jgi:hypothetical protein